MDAHEKIPALLSDAWKLRGQNDYDQARLMVSEAHQLCGDKDFLYLGRIYHIYMQFEADARKYNTAIVNCQKSISYYQQSGNQNKIAHATRHLADLLMQLDKAQEAEKNYEIAIGLYKKDSNTSVLDLANAFRGYAICLEKLDKAQLALGHWQTVKEIYGELGIDEGVQEAERHLNKA